MTSNTPLMLKFLPSSQNLNPDSILNGFLDAIASKNIELYPAQEEAILEIMAGKNIILSTPTGSGKSLVATAMHFKALAEGKRSYYTCPIKALVSEKFFALCKDFGPENVGMLTSDASINRDAPIMCATAEILSNMALSEEESAPVEYAIVDEFHYYSDKDRGIAWQIPLLTLKNTTFLLMSATIGDASKIKSSLEDLNKLEVACVNNSDRPVPLDFAYLETPIHESLYNLISEHKFPIYVVNFTQRECISQAQDAMSVNFCTKEEKKKIQELFAGFRFDTPFGKDIKRYISHGVGVHNAGLLPKYRLLVEKLAQTGLLKIIMGTDTLGVGVNIPIRTVLFTKLCKFDGQKVRILSVRDFKQISGRAGRKGFDDEGSVACQAPEHVIDNKRAENKFAANEKSKKKKITKKNPPTSNFVAWDEKTFQCLIDQPPEALISQFTISHSLIITLLQTTPKNANQRYKRLVEIIALSHETEKNKSKHRKKAALLFHSLISADLVAVVKAPGKKSFIAVNAKLQDDFSLHHTLSLFLIHALEYLDNNDPEYALNILSLVESIAENPKVILLRQIDKLKIAKVAELKADGLDYEARMEELDKIEHPKPLRDFIYNTFNNFEAMHPWVEQENISPKSIVREMTEESSSFNEYVSEYGLQRSEGVLLRYLSTIYKALIQTVPEHFKTDEVYEIIAFLRNIIAKTDSSLVAEWEQMRNPLVEKSDTKALPKPVLAYDPKTNPKPFFAKIRTDMHGLLKAVSKHNYEEAITYIRMRSPSEWTAQSLKDAFEPFYAKHSQILFTPLARQSQFTIIKKHGEDDFTVQQIILDPDDERDWFLESSVSLDSDLNIGDPVIYLNKIDS